VDMKTISTTTLQRKLRVPVSGRFLMELGLAPAKEHSWKGCYWKVEDVPEICRALRDHFDSLSRDLTQDSHE